MAAGGPTPELVKSSCKEPNELAKEFIFQQTMFRIKDVKRSLEFYTGILGMRLLKQLDFPSMKFSLFFLGFEDPKDIPDDEVEKIRWTFKRKACLELTYNWEDDGNTYGCQKGQGFGHIGLCVPDVYKACEWFEKNNVEFIKKPGDGKMKGIAFIKDPDGYSIEILNQEGMVTICTAKYD